MNRPYANRPCLTAGRSATLPGIRSLARSVIGHDDALARNLDGEALVALQRIGQPPQLRDKCTPCVPLLNVSPHKLFSHSNRHLRAPAFQVIEAAVAAHLGPWLHV
ncbi:MAG: hypothetical protein FD130_1739 [Halothiobacillaceae bacterium]|nr:MAG: hypothetical protein FD130_1739 [Halothiobacillaceae bacterium]